MCNQNLVEVPTSSEEILNGTFLHAFRDTVTLPDGNSAIREYFVHPGAVMIIPLLERENGELEVVMERQFRYPIGSVLVEFPAGKLDLGEGSLACAKRELAEETGFHASQWARAGLLHPAIAYSTEFIDIWFAKDLQSGQRHLDDAEFLEVITTTPAQLLEWCATGLVTDAKTLTGALWLQNVLAGAWVLDWQSAP